MYRNSPIPPIIVIIILFLMMLDTKILSGIVCIPTGILMLKQCRKVNEKMLKIMI